MQAAYYTHRPAAIGCMLRKNTVTRRKADPGCRLESGNLSSRRRESCAPLEPGASMSKDFLSTTWPVRRALQRRWVIKVKKTVRLGQQQSRYVASPIESFRFAIA